MPNQTVTVLTVQSCTKCYDPFTEGSIYLNKTTSSCCMRYFAWSDSKLCAHCYKQDSKNQFLLLTIKMVKVTLGKAKNAHRWSRNIALGGLNGVRGQHQAPAALPPGNKNGNYGIGGWMGPRAGLDGCGKPRLLRDSIPGPSSP